jgi:hypothetical protein
MIAKKRLEMDFTYGGLKMNFTKEISQGLLLNTIQRLFLHESSHERQQIFMYKLVRKQLQDLMMPSLKELFQMAGSEIWHRYSGRLRQTSPFLHKAFQAMGDMLQRNEKSREGWLSGSISGNHVSPKLYKISAAEGLILNHYGLNRVAQLYGTNDLNGQIDTQTLASQTQPGVFTEDLITRYPLLVLKCNALATTFLGTGLNTAVVTPVAPFIITCMSSKLSSLHRNLYRKEKEAEIPGPPAYFTRSREGIPVPNLQKFMKGYLNLFKLNISSKTLTNSFNIMNRQIWTNKKQYLSAGNTERVVNEKCNLCDQVETTMHLLFECTKCAEPLWNIVEETINALKDHTTPQAPLYRTHSFLVIYNINDGQISNQYAPQIMSWIQEIKRDLIYRRYKRCTGRMIHLDRSRLAGYLIITISKMISLYKFQGKKHDELIYCKEYLSKILS